MINMNLNPTFKQLETELSKQNNPIALIQNPETIRLLTNFSTDPHERIVALVYSPSATPLLFVPALEHQVAQKAEPDFIVKSYHDHEDGWKLLSDAIKEHFPAEPNFAVEKVDFSLYAAEQVQKHFKDVHFSVDLTPIVQHLRLVKDQEAVEKLVYSGTFADKAIEIGKNALKVGISEREVVAIIEFEMKKLGVSQMSFDTMVLFGDHAADPHGEPGDRTLKENEWVLFDLGTMVDGYASDITRTVFFGNSQEKNPRHQEIYDIVQKAHDTAIAAVKPGMKASQIDKIARDIITEAGYGEYFIHRLGHGIGQSVHEFPSIMEGNDMELVEGMCFSVEPGVYISGDFGVRIEDCGVVTKDGFDLFTSTSKDLLYFD